MQATVRTAPCKHAIPCSRSCVWSWNGDCYCRSLPADECPKCKLELDQQNVIDHTLERLDSNGVAVVSVHDGTIIFLTIAKLDEIRASVVAKGQDRAMIFIQKTVKPGDQN